MVFQKGHYLLGNPYGMLNKAVSSEPGFLNIHCSETHKGEGEAFPFPFFFACKTL
jgi:hypothetical protein